VFVEEEAGRDSAARNICTGLDTVWDAAPLRISALLTVPAGAVLQAILGTLGRAPKSTGG
jgi:hypothetical protein